MALRVSSRVVQLTRVNVKPVLPDQRVPLYWTDALHNPARTEQRVCRVERVRGMVFIGKQNVDRGQYMELARDDVKAFAQHVHT